MGIEIIIIINYNLQTLAKSTENPIIDIKKSNFFDHISRWGGSFLLLFLRFIAFLFIVELLLLLFTINKFLSFLAADVSFDFFPNFESSLSSKF